MKQHLNKEYFEKANTFYNKCVDCKKCLKCCPIIEKEGRSPKEFLKSLSNPSNIEFEDSISCLNCGYCKAVCPMSVDIGHLLFELKKINVKHNKNNDFKKKYKIIKSHQKNSFRKVFINTTESKRVFFPGCSLSANNPELVMKLSELFKESGIGFFSGCCASPSSISGDIELSNNNMKIIIDEMKSKGVEEVIVACSNCYMAFKNNKELEISSIYKVLNENNLIDFESIKNRNDFIIHDPCPTRHEDHIHQSIRELLTKANISFKEFEHNRRETACCGDGSMVSVLNKDISHIQLSKRVEDAKDKRIISYCQSCVSNFKKQLNASLHVLELLLEVDSYKEKENINTLKKWKNRYTISKYVNKLK